MLKLVVVVLSMLSHCWFCCGVAALTLGCLSGCVLFVGCHHFFFFSSSSSSSVVG